MPSLPRLVLVLALLAASTGACAQSPRERVDGVADTIQAHYFDARRGTQIATDLRAAAARGEFDALTDPRDLATTLTARLQPADRHFKVSTTTDTQAPIHFRSEFLHAYLDEQRVVSNKPVVVTQGATEVKAGGMEYTHADGVIRFTGRTRATFAPRPAKP